jgi:L-seryl-tRNA(Ser) seleniumtransferase
VGAGDAAPDGLNARLRALPSVERLAAALDTSHPVAVAAARDTIQEARAAILAGTKIGAATAGGDGAAPDGGRAAGARAAPGVPDLLARARERLVTAESSSLVRVINATGVIVHTNLGRAPLAASAREAVARVADGYANLELDLGTGERGSRQDHVEGVLRELTGAPAAAVVNNGAGAALLAVAALASGRAVVVSRGQLVEIGGAFRIPDVVAQSGARLVEVGTTNRTRLADYERALASLGPDERGAVLRVHPSNFRTLGFVAEVAVEELCSLGTPVIDDVGSGNLAEGLAALADEPPVTRSVAAGAALVCFSGDKLLGGPQAGILVGSVAAVAAARAHPLARALRIDKLALAALDATLRLYRDPARARREVPVLAMLDVPEAQLSERAAALYGRLSAAGIACDVVSAGAKVGGGALPLLELEGPVVAVDPGALGALELARRLRDVRARHVAGGKAVVARIEHERVLLDPRTMTDDDAEVAGAEVVAALR